MAILFSELGAIVKFFFVSSGMSVKRFQPALLNALCRYCPK